jgi:hypothetical protein
MVAISNAADLLGEVRLRGVTEDDLPIFFEHQADPVANRMAAFPPRGDAFMTHWGRGGVLESCASAGAGASPRARSRCSCTRSRNGRSTRGRGANVASIRVLEKCGFTAVESGDDNHDGEVLLRLG